MMTLGWTYLDRSLVRNSLMTKGFSTYKPNARSMRLLDQYYFLALMDFLPNFYAASVREFFSTLEDWRGEYRELHFSIRG